MARSLLAVAAGYLLFGVSAGLLFVLSGRDPHVVPSLAFGLASVAYGVLFAILSGVVTAALAPRAPRAHLRVLGSIVAGIALVSLLLEYQRGSVWTELATLFLMAPATLLGNRFRSSRS